MEMCSGSFAFTGEAAAAAAQLRGGRGSASGRSFHPVCDAKQD